MTKFINLTDIDRSFKGGITINGIPQQGDVIINMEEITVASVSISHCEKFMKGKWINVSNIYGIDIHLKGGVQIYFPIIEVDSDWNNRAYFGLDRAIRIEKENKDRKSVV